MAEFVKVASVTQVPDGDMITVQAGSKRLALARVGDDFFAVDDICSHDRCSLSEQGFIDGATLTCGCHGAQFDVTSGKVLALPATENIGSYAVKREGDDILVQV